MSPPATRSPSLMPLVGIELPGDAPVQGGHVHAPRDEDVPRDGRDRPQRALDAVKDLAQQARPQLHGQGAARAGDGVAHGQAGRVLVDLHGEEGGGGGRG